MSDIAAIMDVESKIGVMVAILLVSLLAVSFPTLSEQIPFLRIPPILFFVGKHFGTGVILATAFLHLLDDAFRSLRSPVIENKYGKIGKWTGLIILGSLLTIFLIEYASTTYVEHLRNKPSAPSTPTISARPQPQLSSRGDINILSHVPSKRLVSETTPLLLAQRDTIDPSITTVQASIPISTPAASVLPSLSRPHSPSKIVPHDHHSHCRHHPHVVPSKPILPVVDFIEVLTNSPRICRLGLAGEHQHHHHQHDHEGDDGLSRGCISRRHSVVRVEGGNEYHEQHHSDAAHSPSIGRRRQILSILVLQFGIMIHSLVIGLTLAIATGSDFTSLTTAIIFHQLFEGLSLGIRVAALPPPKKIHDEYTDENGRTDCNGGVSASEETSHVSQRILNRKNNVSRSSFSHSRSPGVNGAGNLWMPKWKSWKVSHWLKPTLSLLFAITTPFGMTLGILLFGPTQRDASSMLLIQGVMSAISAGMLIYAATVEMIAGDFVFGDVDGGYHHQHHESLADQAQSSTSVSGREDDYEYRSVEQHRGCLYEDEDAEAQRQDLGGTRGQFLPLPFTDEGTAQERASMAKRVLAVLSLLLGVAMMIVVGIGE